MSGAGLRRAFGFSRRAQSPVRCPVAAREREREEGGPGPLRSQRLSSPFCLKRSRLSSWLHGRVHVQTDTHSRARPFLIVGRRPSHTTTMLWHASCSAFARSLGHGIPPRQRAGQSRCAHSPHTLASRDLSRETDTDSAQRGPLFLVSLSVWV